MPRKQLYSILYEGEIVQYNQANGQVWQATYSNGLLISTIDAKKTFTSPSSFVNDCKGGNSNGYALCKVCRDGVWIKLGDLPKLDDAPPPATLKVKRREEEEEMPQAKKASHLLKSPQAHLPAASTIFATVVESIDEPIEIANVVRIKVKPTAFGSSTHFYDAEGQRVFERKEDGTLGKYKGCLRNKRLVPEPLIASE
jgi:hypothetical protein